MLDAVNSGRYEPKTPFRFPLAKSQGFSRTMTLPQIPDLVLYRALTTLIYKRAKPFQRGNVYFARNTLSKRSHQLKEDLDGDTAYTFTSGSAYLKWKEFHQYRKKLLIDELYPYFVLTDVSNYFDSILYARTVDAIHSTDLGRNLVGLLFFLLERLSPRDPYNESPRIGLPVDEFDCSRTLAHLVLFPHDARMLDTVEEPAYVRWMDDQMMGVESYPAGVRVLGQCGTSLSRLHLTPNTAKSAVLSLRELATHFHLELNHELDRVEELLDQQDDCGAAGTVVQDLWQSYKGDEGHGEWKKVLLRFYRLAGICRQDFLLDRAKGNILRHPTLATRVGDYVRVLSSASDYFAFFLNVCADDLQIYPDVSRFLAEGLLKLEPGRADARVLRDCASDLLAGKKYEFAGLRECTAIAPLMILRFGDRRSLPRLKVCVEELESSEDPAIGKAVAAVYSSYGETEHQEVVRASSKLSSNYLAEFLLMVDGAKRYTKVPPRFKIRRRPIFDSVARRERVDLRKLLALRFLRLNQEPSVADWLARTRCWMTEQKVSAFDRALVNRTLG